jgi:predicted alpha/beta superfamily hydrolase
VSSTAADDKLHINQTNEATARSSAKSPYPTVQWLDGEGFADLLRSTSLYRRLDHDVREPLLESIAERIRTRMGDRASRRYLSVLRVGRRGP